MKRKNYTKPEVVVVKLKMSHTLLAGSPTGDTTSATTQKGGTLNARGTSGFWDDDDDE